ncbi:MAG: dihydrodipicolinate reductase C-terminal domain-containing protein [Balneolaceae bacterium]
MKLLSNMKIAVIGTGRTGSAVVDLLGEQAIAFDKENKPAVEDLAPLDGAIIFVPGDSAAPVVETVLQSGIPAVWGTTGYAWPADLPERVKRAGGRWVIGSNFSLGMNIVRKCLETIGQSSSFLKNPSYHIHEVHHTGKKDAPSGTALSWHEWLGTDAHISSAREGDVKGIHELHVKTASESIFLKHEAHSRSVFAEGAVWTMNYLLDNPFMKPGFYSFESIFDQVFTNK